MTADLFASPAPAVEPLLFFGLRLEAPPRAAVERASAALQEGLGLGGRAVRPENYHVTVCLPVFKRLREPKETALQRAASGVRMPPFELVLDAATGFRRPGGDQPFVLCVDDAGTAHVLALRHVLDVELQRHGMGAAAGVGKHPHLTLLRSPACPPRQPIAPIAWTATSFALIESVAGEPHIVRGEWALQSRG